MNRITPKEIKIVSNILKANRIDDVYDIGTTITMPDHVFMSECLIGDCHISWYNENCEIFTRKCDIKIDDNFSRQSWTFFPSEKFREIAGSVLNKKKRKTT